MAVIADVTVRAYLDRRGIHCLKRVLNDLESLEDLASWRPEVGRMTRNLKRAIHHLKVKAEPRQ